MRRSKRPFAIVEIRLLRRALLGALAVLAMSNVGPPSQRAYASASWQKLTQAELTVIWWQWLYRVPASQSATFDDTGANAYNGQPYSDLLFLTGTLSSTVVGGDVLGSAMRSINVKQGTALFFPLLNDEFDNVCGRPSLGGDCNPNATKFPNNLGVPQLQAMAAESIDFASDLRVTLTPTDQNFNQNGPPIPLVYTRLPSPQPFPYKLPATDNLLQFQGINIRGTVAPAVGDGYYSLIPLGTLTLEQGYYKLNFGGKVPLTGGNFILDITYDITVTP
jgi:hypothetical protein